MLLRDFPGADKFIHEVDEAVSADCTKEVTDRLRQTLSLLRAVSNFSLR